MPEVVNEDSNRVRKDSAGLESGVSLNNSRVTAAVKSGHLMARERQRGVAGLERAYLLSNTSRVPSSPAIAVS